MLGELGNWARAIRVPLLAASVVSVVNGLVIAWAQLHAFNLLYAVLTLIGVVCAHASIDLLNDYFDFKKTIDLKTVRTRFSGGTGVLPERRLEPKSVYRMGMLLLVAGAVIGVLLTVSRGWVVGGFLLFGILSIYFYSIKIANVGLGEIFLVIKGTLIVLGSYYVQTLLLGVVPLYIGVILGLLSASALYVNEFPDYEADKVCGRYNLVVRLGLRRAAKLYAIFPALVFGMIIAGIIARIIPLFGIVTLIALPLCWRTAQSLWRAGFKGNSVLVPAMAQNVLAARIIGVVLAVSYLLVSV